MDPEEGEVDDEREEDETDDACEEVLGESFLWTQQATRTSASKPITPERLMRAHHGHRVGSLDIHQLPEIPNDGGSNRAESQESDHLAAERAGEEESGEEEPLPPFGREGSVSELVELDVGEERHGHEEDQSSVEEDESSFGDVEVICSREKTKSVQSR